MRTSSKLSDKFVTPPTNILYGETDCLLELTVEGEGRGFEDGLEGEGVAGLGCEGVGAFFIDQLVRW